MVTVGSLCTGIGGLEYGLQLAGVDVEPVFVSDIDKGACAWLEANRPGVPNLGDFTALDDLPPVDLITAGFPCQPLSTAGKRQGVEDDRWLWDDIARLVGRMEPRPVLFLENVPGLLTANGGDAMARIVHRLASIGYVFTWRTLAASDIGAPHRRNRWWGVAWHADSEGLEGSRPSRTATEQREPAENSDGEPWSDRTGRDYWPGIHRWERLMGRTAPDSTIDGRLSPLFVEWMMGYPAGWVTGTLTNRRQALHALGNAVVPQCAAAAFVELRDRFQ